ncbi:MAG: hypothetical protein KAU99_04140 [Thermoplasmata archaeon]|nr:hypothetical protein [Thermoplasmata archaeon]
MVLDTEETGEEEKTGSDVSRRNNIVSVHNVNWDGKWRRSKIRLDL